MATLFAEPAVATVGVSAGNSNNITRTGQRSDLGSPPDDFRQKVLAGRGVLLASCPNCRKQVLDGNRINIIGHPRMLLDEAREVSSSATRAWQKTTFQNQ